MRLLFIIFSLIVVNALTAQSFFKSMPKFERGEREENEHHKLKLNKTATDDIVTNVWRPIANVAAYAVPGNVLLTGAGISYQHLVWVTTTSKWNCKWSVSAMSFVGGSLSNATGVNTISYGLMLGLLNNLIMIGPAINGNKVLATVALGISLNN